MMNERVSLAGATARAKYWARQSGIPYYVRETVRHGEFCMSTVRPPTLPYFVVMPDGSVQSMLARCSCGTDRVGLHGVDRCDTIT